MNGYEIVRNTGWNNNIQWAWVVVKDGLVVYGSDLASRCQYWVESL